MNKCWLLLKVQLLGFFNVNRLLHTKDKKDKRQLVMMGAVMLLVLAMVIMYSSTLAIGYAYLGLENMIPATVLIICAVITLAITFFKSNGVLFGFRDYDMVMSLPVNNVAVIISRLLTVYIMNFFISCVGMLPAIIVYGITVNASLSVWLMIAISPFLAPLLPMMVSMILGALITAVSVRFRYKNLVMAILSIAATILVLIISTFYGGQLDNTSQLAAIGTALAEAINRIYPPAVLFTHALVHSDWGSFLQFAFISIGITIVFVLLLSIFYDKINAALFAGRTKSNYHVGELKTSTPFMALYVKELRRLLSCPIYLVNSSIGAVLLIVMGISFLFLNTEQIDAMLGIPDVMAIGKQLAPWLVSLLIAMSSTTAASISIEGKSRWLMCSSPVTTMTVSNAKIAANLTILVPAILISSTLLAIGLQTNLTETTALFLIPLTYSLFIATIGLAFNLKFPKYDWTSEQQAVKQSISVLATLLVGMIVALIFCGLTFILGNHPIITLFGSTILIIGATAVIYQKVVKHKLYG